MASPTLSEVLDSLFRAGYAPATSTTPLHQWSNGRAVRRVTFGDPRPGGARGELVVSSRGRVIRGHVDYGDRAMPGTEPWPVANTTEAFWSVCDLWPTVDSSWGHRVRSVAADTPESVDSTR